MIQCKNREQWFDPCGLWKRGDLRRTVTTKSKLSTTTKSASIASLKINIEALASTSADTATTTANTPSEGQEGAGKHLPDVATPTADEDIGAPKTPTETNPLRRSSLSSLNTETPSSDDQKTRRKSAAS